MGTTMAGGILTTQVVRSTTSKGGANTDHPSEQRGRGRHFLRWTLRGRVVVWSDMGNGCSAPIHENSLSAPSSQNLHVSGCLLTISSHGTWQAKNVLP